jgi:hypothetical protein
VTSSSGCGLPAAPQDMFHSNHVATPYSVICISSPDEHVSSLVASSIEVFIDEKYYIKASDVIVADGISDLQSALPISQSDSVLRESSLESEHLELNPTKAISSMSCRRYHSGDF